MISRKCVIIHIIILKFHQMNTYVFNNVFNDINRLYVQKQKCFKLLVWYSCKRVKHLFRQTSFYVSSYKYVHKCVVKIQLHCISELYLNYNGDEVELERWFKNIRTCHSIISLLISTSSIYMHSGQVVMIWLISVSELTLHWVYNIHTLRQVANLFNKVTFCV